MGDEIVRKIQVGEKIIEYNLIRKNVKRINMRVKLDGTVWISANDSEPISKIGKLYEDSGNVGIFSIYGFFSNQAAGGRTGMPAF